MRKEIDCNYTKEDVEGAVCKYCGSVIGIDNKFYDVETCVKCYKKIMAGKDPNRYYKGEPIRHGM